MHKFDNNDVFSIRNISFSYPSYKIRYDEEGNKEIDDSIQENKVLKNISIDIKKGETIAFVGRSGCGKTTLLKLLAGFYKVTKGSIIKNDRYAWYYNMQFKTADS